ncbi:adult cuticle protein 1-like [Schistocerca nitens]|uniref:adult cuticle protein 1-like n=1 Tax=Schistocerca cancellata TaxID=274614 RepID=UPI0021198A04|nr:adult cuticle protein 1-like [Schistocerca cancellata]XP_049809545.1 adult cuticle protein 1-like [Schistocerca nitens]
MARSLAVAVLLVLSLACSGALAGLLPYAVAPYGSSYTAHAINHEVAAPVAVPAAAPLVAAPAAPLVAAAHAPLFAAPAHYTYLARR